ncbi:hypothetical protein LCGC14_0651110 [marine sediment metagenome]|uniref:Uncharacterized protein n=1 Tax=marine sediment metagenome TaxID=412755 RepID=A0A0F9RG16_9ZZZZ
MKLKLIILMLVMNLLVSLVSGFTREEICANALVFNDFENLTSNEGLGTQGTIVGDPVLSGSGGQGNSAFGTFDGVGDAVTYVDAAVFTDIWNISYLIWVKQGAVNDVKGLVSAGNPGVSSESVINSDDRVGQKNYHMDDSAGGGLAKITTPNAPLITNTWFVAGGNVNVSSISSGANTNGLFINKTQVASGTDIGYDKSGTAIYLGDVTSSPASFTGDIGQSLIVNLSLASSDFEDFFDVTVDGTSYCPIAPPSDTFSITVIDFHNDSSINSFTVILTNATDTLTNSTTTGDINFENLTQGIYDITIQSSESGGYFDRIFENFNVSNNIEAKIWQAIVYINASDIVDGIKIDDFWVRVDSQLNNSNSTGFATLRLNAKSHNIIGNATGFFETTQNLSLAPLETKFFELQFGRNLLSINATDIFSNQKINSFTVNVVGINVTYDRTLSTTTGQINFSIFNGNFTAFFSSDTHATTSLNVTVDDTIENLTFQPFPINSIFIKIFREGTTELIDLQEVTADFDSDDQVLNLSTNNGTILAESLFPGGYTITIGSNGFNTRDYILTLLPSSNVELNAFLVNATTTAEITFTIKDASTLANLDNVLVSVSDKINLTHVIIAQRTTDISGQVIFNLDQTKKYRFTLTRTDFETKIFDLTPSSTTYTINIDPSILIDYTTIFNNIDFLTLPVNSFITELGIINFTIITASVEGSVINFFGVNTTFESSEIKTNVSGSAGGGTATIEVNLTQAFTAIEITFFIDVDGRSPFIIDRQFYITNVTAGNNTLAAVMDLLDDEIPIIYLTIIGTFIVLLIVATAASLGLRDRRLNVVAGGTMGMLSIPGLQMFNPLISVPIIIILIAAYFIGGSRADD